jgi:hypothetical protein
MDIITDNQLLEIYLKGFSNELDNKSYNENYKGIESIAYEYGKLDAITGDDIMSLNYQNDTEILNKIKDSFNKK